MSYSTHLNKEEVTYYYQEHNLNECSKKFNCCSETIKRKLLLWGIKTRTKKEAFSLYYKSEKSDKIRMERSRRQRKKYKELGQEMFSKEFRKNIGRIRELKPKQDNQNNGNWRGGRLSWWRYQIINKAGGKCEVCGWRKLPEILEAHHIDHNKKNNLIENGLSVCPLCHRKIHYWNLKNKKEVFNKLSKEL
jgi:hypothetical protein